MLVNLLFTALFLGLAFLLTLVSHAGRHVQPMRVSRQDRDYRAGPGRQD